MGSEKIEELAERIEKLEKENKELRETVSKLRSSDQEVSETDKKKEQISRRGFLKKLGAGAIGLGALSLAPAASKITIGDTGITKDGTSSFWHQGNLSPSNYIEDSDSVVTTSHLDFDPATQTELDNHSGTAGAHHSKYTDSEAVTAVNSETSLSVDISGDSDSVDGYDITKNDGGGSGIIDFST